MSLHRLGGLALAAAMVLSACGGGSRGGRLGSMSSEERSLLSYIPEVLRPTCATHYHTQEEFTGVWVDTDVVALYPGAVAGFACRYDNAEVRYLRYRTVSSLHAALEDRWGLDAGGCARWTGVLSGPEYRYRVAGGPVRGLVRLGRFTFYALNATWTDDRARVLGDADTLPGEQNEAGAMNLNWEPLVSRFSLDAGASSPTVDLQRVTPGVDVQANPSRVPVVTGIGKSTLLLQLVANVSSAGLPCLLASGEESASRISVKARRTGIPERR